MIVSAEAFEENLGVMIFAGTTNSDADWESYIATFTDLDAKAAKNPLRPVLIQIIEPGNPIPNAAWRKRLADTSRDLRSNALCILVTRSSIVRGAVTAINWLRRPTYELVFADDFAGAVRLAEERRGTPLPTLTRLEREARRKARWRLDP